MTLKCPPPFLYYRTLGFPQYGERVGISNEVFTRISELSGPSHTPRSLFGLILRMAFSTKAMPPLNPMKNLYGLHWISLLRSSLFQKLCCFWLQHLTTSSAPLKSVQRVFDILLSFEIMLISLLMGKDMALFPYF